MSSEILSVKAALEAAKKNGAASVLKTFSDRAAKLNPKLNAFLRFDPAKINSNSSSGSLAGVPVSIKDNICIEGLETTCASKILAGHLPPYNATVIEKLKNSGAALFGQCNMDEFAFGSSSETSAFGPVKKIGRASCRERVCQYV